MCINKAAYFQKIIKIIIIIIKNANEKVREKFFMKKMKLEKQ
jgi:hypothetical protein